MLISFFFMADPKTPSSGSVSVAPGRSGHETQDVPRHHLIFLLYVVFPPARDRPLTPIKGRFADSLTVSHFQKSAKMAEVGSQGNGLQVIYLSCYLVGYYKYGNIYDSDNNLYYCV